MTNRSTFSVPAGRILCFVLRHNHFDSTWRRCWDRDFLDAGRRFISYRTIQTQVLDDNIAAAADGKSKFMVEVTWTTRHYLERRPKQLATLQRLAKDGLFEQLGAGENIIDPNLVHGEMLVRNLVLGTLWTQKTFGTRPPTGYYRDTFGSSAQLPQIFRQCGFTWIAHLDYNTPDAPFWRGLDGSSVFFLHGSVMPFHWAAKRGIPFVIPCKTCKGMDAKCTACEGRGYEPPLRADFAYQPAASKGGRAEIFLIGNEETMPGMNVPAEIDAFNKSQDQYYAVPATYHDIEPYIADLLAKVDNPPADMISSKVENNPTMTGVFVSRIRVKQNHRRLEQAAMAADAWDTILGKGRQAETVRGEWRKLSFSAFHDSVTGATMDQAYDEIIDIQNSIEQTLQGVTAPLLKSAVKTAADAVTVFNPTGQSASMPVSVSLPKGWQGAEVAADGAAIPVYKTSAEASGATLSFLAADVPAMSARTFTLKKAAAKSADITDSRVTCGDYSVEVGPRGITALESAHAGRVTDTANLLLGELTLEDDIGDPWATREIPTQHERLSQYTKLAGVRAHGDSVEVTYQGRHPGDGLFGPNDPCVTRLSWTQTFRLMKGCPWLEVDTDVAWYTFNRRLRLAFPSASRENTGVYDIPYGVLERPRYDRTDRGDICTPGGDWPAVNWGGIQRPGYTFAVFNRGTPSYRVQDGAVLVSVLRSPVLPSGLLQVDSFVTTNFHQMVHHGEYSFRHAIYIGKGDWRDNNAAGLANQFNAGLTALGGTLKAPLHAWRLDAQGTRITALKSAEDGNGVVVRLVEYNGRHDQPVLHVPAQYSKAELVNLLEDTVAPLEVRGGTVRLEMGPYKIASVRLT